MSLLTEKQSRSCKFIKEFKHLPANMRVNNRRSEGGKNQQKKDQGPLINTELPFEPSWIYKIISGTDLIEGRQEDAEEFLGCLLNNLNDEMLEVGGLKLYFLFIIGLSHFYKLNQRYSCKCISVLK